MGIKKVIICGLGALGLTYANKLKDVCELKILANIERIEKYKNFSPKLNNNNILLEYITPDEKFDADLIIISTKSDGLKSAIEYIKNFVGKNTKIISLINGISSEEKIASIYGQDKIVRAFFIGHSAMKAPEGYLQDGIGKIVMEPCEVLENFFKETELDYEISKDIIYSQWVKLGVNIVLNQLTALRECTVGELRCQKDYKDIARNLIKEVILIANRIGVSNLDKFEYDVFASIDLIADNGKTSMHQDIIAKRKTEIEIFSGEIVNFGRKFGIEVPYNQEIYNKIRRKEESFL